MFKKNVNRSIKNHHTVEWWMEKIGSGSIHRLAFRLNALSKEGNVEKVSGGEFEKVRFIPSPIYSERDIVMMLIEQDKKMREEKRKKKEKQDE